MRVIRRLGAQLQAHVLSPVWITHVYSLLVFFEDNVYLDLDGYTRVQPLLVRQVY